MLKYSLITAHRIKLIQIPKVSKENFRLDKYHLMKTVT